MGGGPDKMPIEERLAKWEAKHGFRGMASPSGRDILRMCDCGKATPNLANPKCIPCDRASGNYRAGKRTREYEMRGNEAREEPTPRQCGPPRRPPPVDPSRYLRCRTKGCDRIAKHRGTLCPQCWVAKDPEERACPICRKAPRVTCRQWGVCTSCARNVKRAAARLWHVSGGQMAIACSALAHEGMEADSQHEANQLLEALDAGALASEHIDASVFSP